MTNATTTNDDPIRTKYPWTPDMGEISGFGGAYEAACLRMMYAGLAWLDARAETNAPAPTLEARVPAGVYGLFDPTSDDAKDLEKAILDEVPDCSGAMHQATMSICFYVAKNGWPAFVEAKRARARKP